MNGSQFNLRVYGLLINEHEEILLSDEYRFGHAFTKFPGGGLEFGEGLKDGLQREIREELSLEVEIGELFYFNDFVQLSKFNKAHQLFSFYYIVRPQNANELFREDYELPLKAEGEKQRWVKIASLTKEMFTFPIDQLVVEMLLANY